MTARTKAILALIIANVIWGAASPIFKWSLTNIPIFTLALLRFSLGSLLLAPLIINKPIHIKRADWRLIFLFGFFGVTINISFFFLGLRLASSINASIIATAQPLFIMLIGVLWLKEKVEKFEIAGTMIALAGVMVIILSPIFSDGITAKFSVLGNLFFVLAMLGAVGQTILGKQLFNKYPNSLPITFYAFCIGSLTFFPLFLIEYIQNPQWLAYLDMAGIIGIIYGVVLSSTLAYLLYDWSLSKIEASETGIFSYLMPITAILIAVPFFGEKITWAFVIGSSLVLGGILLTERRLPAIRQRL